jgi:hypothetical protein
MSRRIELASDCDESDCVGGDRACEALRECPQHPQRTVMSCWRAGEPRTRGSADTIELWPLGHFALAYLALLFASPEWRATTRLLLTRTPWRTIARSACDAFPTSHWRGAARLIGVPFAWYFTALMLVLAALALTAIEIVFSPWAIYCSVVHLSRRFLQWWTPPPNHTRPPAVALAMPKPKPSIVDAVGRMHIGR